MPFILRDTILSRMPVHGEPHASRRIWAFSTSGLPVETDDGADMQFGRINAPAGFGVLPPSRTYRSIIIASGI